MNNSDSHRPRAKSQQVLAKLLGAILALAVVAVGTILVMRSGAVPELQPAEFVAAQQRWDENSVTDYIIETKVEGQQPAIYRVEVVGGQVKSATRNGNALRDRRTLGTWSVPGMFGTMERDVEANESADAGQEPLHLRAEFDSELGIPRRYVRLAWGTKVTTSWEVTSFTIGTSNEQ